MKESTYNMDQLIKIELIDAEVDPYWKISSTKKKYL